MRLTFASVMVLLLAVSACKSDETTEADTVTEEVEPNIVVRTRRDAAGNAVSVLVDEARNAVLANGRYLAATRHWEVNVAEPRVQEFREDLALVPTLPDMNARLVAAWREVAAGVNDTAKAYDNPGCDLVPDALESHCVQNCCAIHDQCYHDNNCSFTSWLPYVGSSACDACNTNVRQCVGKCTFDPPACGDSACGCNQSQCYDANCAAGQTLYCANDCNNPGAGPCRNPTPYPLEACVYADGATRFSLHGGAVGACVPWCENAGSGKASGWWYNETLWCCVCEHPSERETWPWLTKPWPYPIPEIHWRGDGHFHPTTGGEDCWDALYGFWLCG